MLGLNRVASLLGASHLHVYGLLGGKYFQLQSQTPYELEMVTTLLPCALSGLLWHLLLAHSLRK